MLHLSGEICKSHLDAVDGRVGKIKDLYFDDASWTVRYLVVQTGPWLHRQEVLIAPQAITDFNGAAQSLRTNLTLKQVEGSPHAESQPPASRQYEERLHDYYGWSPYWDGVASAGYGLYSYPAMPYPSEQERRNFGRQEKAEASLAHPGDCHLRSFRQVHGYAIHARDGEIGEITDLMIEPETWRITHLVADTSVWLSSEQVVIDKAMVTSISFINHSVDVAMTRHDVESAPKFQPGMTIREPFQQTLSSYYKGMASSYGSQI